MMDISSIPYQRLSIYQTKARLYIVGYCKLRNSAALLKISKQEPSQLDVAEVAGRYSLAEIRTMLGQIHMANAHLGGLQLVTHCCGIIGCFRFTETCYLLLVTRKAHVGSLCGGHRVYTVAATALVPLHPGGYAGGGGGGASGGGGSGGPSGAAEKRYVKLLMAMDLTKHFYFSYTYNLAHTVQRNCRTALLNSCQEPFAPPLAPGGPAASGIGSSVYDSMFTWNSYLTAALRRALGGNERWTVPLIHGFWEQRRLSIYGRPLTVTLIARRSRHFAGTRYRKRGLNDGGKVANEVETEQVVDAGTDYRTRTPLMSSVVQVRGSVPLFWSQQLTALSPKPEIVLQQYDPLYEVTEAHFADLEARYGAPAVVLNLLKSKERRPRETLLRRELATAVAQLNGARGRGHQQIVYIPWDFSKHAKQSGANLLSELAAITRLGLDMTGLFVHNPAAHPPHRLPYAPMGTSATSTSASTSAPPAPTTHRAVMAAARQPHRASSTAALRRSAGEGGSSMHLAAAAEAAAAAVRARKVSTGATTTTTSTRISATGWGPMGDYSSHSHSHSQVHHHAHRRFSRDLQQHMDRSSSSSRLGLIGSSSGGGGSGGGSGSGGGGGVACTSPSSPPSRTISATTINPGVPGVVQWQAGVLRTNCIDCLDRTNVAQFAFGLVAFGRQLYKLGLTDVRDIDADSSAAFSLMALYEAMGHVLSLQYGGSEAHTIFFQRKKGEWEAATQSKDMLTSIKRLYSNTYTDAEKQDAINLFLGNFVPQPGQPHLWQLDTDYYLHSETTMRPTLPPPTPMAPPTSSTAVTPGSSAPPTPLGPAAAAAASPRERGYNPFRDTPFAAVETAAAEVAAAEATATASTAVKGAAPDVAPEGPSEAASALMVTATAANNAAVASVSSGGGLRSTASGFPCLPGDSTPPPLDISSDDDEDAVRGPPPPRPPPYPSAGSTDSAGGSSSASSASAAGTSPAAMYAAYASSAIPFHRAPATSFFASLLPSLSRTSVTSTTAGVSGLIGTSGGGLFERVVASLLAPGGAARSSVAGVGGGVSGSDWLGGSAEGRSARALVSFDVALARAPNQVWSVRLHDEEDKQGRWAAVQSAFSFFWTSNSGGGVDGAGGGPRNNYQLDDAPRPPLRPGQPASPAALRLTAPTPSGLASPTPSGIHSPLSPAASTLLPTLPFSPDISRHGGVSSVVVRTITAGTDGGISVMSDGSTARNTLTATVGAATAAAAALTSAVNTTMTGGASSTTNRQRVLGQVLDALVDADHLDEHHGHGHGTTSCTVADMIPALAASGDNSDGGTDGSGGRRGGLLTDDDGDEFDGAYYYSAADAEAAAGQIDGANGGARQSGVRQAVVSVFGTTLLSQSGQTGSAGGGGSGGGGGKQIPGTPYGGIPVLNDFIEVVSPQPLPYGGADGGGSWRVALSGQAPGPDLAARRRTAAEVAAKARDEEKQRKLLTAGLEVSDLLGLGLEDLGINWELQPWWQLEPRPTYVPRAHEPHPSRLREVRQRAAEAVARRREQEAAVVEQKRQQRLQREGREGVGGVPVHDLLMFSSSEDEDEGQEGMRESGCGGGRADGSRVAGGGVASSSSMGPELPADPAPYTDLVSYPWWSYVPYVEPPPRLQKLQQKQRVEHTALLHYDVAQAHARAKFSEFLAAVPQPYNLCGEEHRRDVTLYDSYCYIERL